MSLARSHSLSRRSLPSRLEYCLAIARRFISARQASSFFRRRDLLNVMMCFLMIGEQTGSEQSGDRSSASTQVSFAKPHKVSAPEVQLARSSVAMSAIDSGHGSDSGYVAEARDDERRIAPSEAADGDDLATDSNDESDVDEDVEGSDRPETPEFRAPLPHQRAPPPEGTPLSPPRPMPQTLPASPSSTVAPPQTAPAVAPENNLANSDVMVKYRTAADIANDVLRRVVEVVRPGSRVVELCAYGDSLILESVGLEGK